MSEEFLEEFNMSWREFHTKSTELIEFVSEVFPELTLCDIARGIAEIHDALVVNKNWEEYSKKIPLGVIARMQLILDTHSVLFPTVPPGVVVLYWHQRYHRDNPGNEVEETMHKINEIMENVRSFEDAKNVMQEIQKLPLVSATILTEGDHVVSTGGQDISPEIAKLVQQEYGFQVPADYISD